jgi:deoxyribonuclease-4
VIAGAHVSRRGEGVTGAFAECRRRRAACAQVFLSNPRAWAPPSFADEVAAAFGAAWRGSGLGPLAAHAPYPVNIASADPGTLRRSRRLLTATARTAEALGVDILVVHAGSGGSASTGVARRRAAMSLREVIAAAPRVRVVAELMAGTAGAVASRPEEAAELLNAVGDHRLGLCLDTCHLFAAGVSLDRPDGAEGLVDDLERLGVLSRVALVHVNDSVFGRGERRDRHADLGDGRIGRRGVGALARTTLGEVPWVLETPGDADRQRADLAWLRRAARR